MGTNNPHSYQLKINAVIKNVIAAKAGVTVTKQTVTTANGFKNGTNELSVRACDLSGVCGAWSKIDKTLEVVGVTTNTTSSQTGNVSTNNTDKPIDVLCNSNGCTPVETVPTVAKIIGMSTVQRYIDANDYIAMSFYSDIKPDHYKVKLNNKTLGIQVVSNSFTYRVTTDNGFIEGNNTVSVRACNKDNFCSPWSEVKTFNAQY